MGERKCISCEKVLPKEDFYIRKSNKDGYDKRCKKCFKIYKNRHIKDKEIYRKLVISSIHNVPIFKKGQEVCLRFHNCDGRDNNIKTFKGNVIFVNSKHLTVKGKDYSMSFMFEQFREGEIQIVR
jgi:uncharacterized Zn finger protein